MRRTLGVAGVAAAALIGSAEAADAHIVASRLGDLYAGALHPLTDLQDLILWIALGVLAGSLGPAKGRWLVPVFPLGLGAGLLLGLASGVASAGPVADAGMILVMGLLIAAEMRMPATLLCAIALGLALIRGAANAGGVGPETSWLLFATGLASAGYVAITLIMGLTVAFRGADAAPSMTWRSIATRALGSWIAAIGLMMGGFAFAA